MKTKITTFLLLLGSSSMFAQQPWATNGNIIAPTNYLGTNNNQPLNFRTNSVQRMLIDQGGNGGLNGRVAMGNNLPANFIPLDRLHLHHTDNSNVFTRYTNSQSTPGGGSQIGIVRAGTYDNELRVVQNESKAIRFFNVGSTFYIMPLGRTYVGRQQPDDLVLANRFTIDSDPSDATRSGLRFIDLNLNSTFDVTTPPRGYLSLNATGDVIWAPGPGAANASNGVCISASTVDNNVGDVVLGQEFGETGNPGQILRFREIPMNGGKIMFTDNGNGGVFPTGGEINKISIGLDNNVTPAGKLHINVDPTDEAPVALQVDQFHSLAGSSPIGIDVNAAGASVNKRGIDINVTGGSQENYGIDILSSGGSLSYGVNSIAQNSTISNVGVVAKGQGAATGVNTGLDATASGGSINYAVKALALPLPNSFAGHFTGNVEVTDRLNANALTSFSLTVTTPANLAGTLFPSDVNLKTDIAAMTQGMQIIQQLQPKTYYYDTLANNGFDFSSNKQYGFVAQEIELILPEMVSMNTLAAKYDENGAVITPELNYKALNYNAFFAILTKGMQEQQSQLIAKDSLINNLNDRLTQLEACLAAAFPNLCNANQGMILQHDDQTQEQIKGALEVHLKDENVVLLSQNVPNPFAESTTIKYFVAENVAKAQLQFTNQFGKLIQSVDINERGNGEVKVFAADLSAGIYTYQLVADGKVVASKKMFKN